jgi:alkylation response protein AidB-like acyl-CoA dehydrogenase
MDFDFSDDQEQLRDAVHKWVDKSYSFEHRRTVVKAGGFSREAYEGLAGLGLAGLYIADEHGGMGMGPVEGMIAMEELGRGIVLEPLGQTLLASGVLSAYGDAAVQKAWLPKIAAGETLVVLAHQEKSARYRLDTRRRPKPERPGQSAATKASSPPVTAQTPFWCPLAWVARAHSS